MRGLSELFDAIPRTRVGILGREAPAFRTAGVFGYYLALLAVLLLGPLAGRSLFALLGASSVCALSFFGYAHLRKVLTGREQLVLLEHVWVALIASVAFFWAAEVPLTAHLDPVVIGLAFFLACGRAGCLMVGCCHGRPSELGIRYGEDAVRDGFPRHLQGVRLFPVQLLESFGLVVLGLVSIPVLFLAPPGSALGTFLIGYGVMRFGLEGLRGDVRPHLLGLSQSRWMALAEVLLALALSVPRHELLNPSRTVLAGAAAALVAVLLLLASAWTARRRERALLASEHVAELEALAATLVSRAGVEPVVATSTLGVRLALSRLAGTVGGGREEAFQGGLPPGVTVSLSQPSGTRDIELLRRLAEAVGGRRLGAPRVLRNGAVLLASDDELSGTGGGAELAAAPPPRRALSSSADLPRASYFDGTGAKA